MWNQRDDFSLGLEMRGLTGIQAMPQLLHLAQV
jgi:hypothetical protein